MVLELNSNEVVTPESQKYFARIIDHLIRELVNDKFELRTSVSNTGKFRINISRIPHKEKKIYRVNYDVNLFRMIYDVLYIILSNNEFFPSMGKSSGVFSVPTIEVSDWLVLDLAMSDNGPVCFDEERVELHRFIYKLCLHFIARHEIRHIANGHIDYLAGKFVEGSNNGLSNIDSQTLEMDVDSCVTSGFLHGLIDLPEQLNHVPEKLRDPRSLFESLLFAMKVLFYCLPSRKVSTIEEARDFSHPNSTLRYFYSFTSGLSYLQEKNPGLSELFGKVYQDSWSFVDLLGAQGILSAEKIWTDYCWSMSDEGMEHAFGVWKNWNIWIPRLEPYAYLKLAPAEED